MARSTSSCHSVQFGTKAQTLSGLKAVIQTAEVLPVLSFSVSYYQSNKKEILADIQLFSKENVVIRSSAQNEDCLEGSNAGHYESVLDVPTRNVDTLESAIGRVIGSYDNEPLNEILIQPMLKTVSCAGVAFTCDIDSLAPYYVINYDLSGSTDSITSGTETQHRTYVQFKESPHTAECNNIAALIESLKELEKLFNHPFLDVEFAFTSDGKLYILQVRPVSTAGKEDLSSYDLKDLLAKVYSKIQKLNRPHPNLLGAKTLFGVMPDWNPAEIIGTKPKKLGLTLYKELITDSIWAYQRDNYGYRTLRSHPLLVSFLGAPFIDVRIDFNSFIPKSLEEPVAEKLVNHYLTELGNHPEYHDKIEFKIVHSCYYFTLGSKLEELKSKGFSFDDISQIKRSLLEVTNSIIHPEKGLYKRDLEKIEYLKNRFETVCESELALIDQIYWLTEDCKRYGTLPFAGIARAAFIAIQFLQSMVDIEIISESDYHSFMNSLTTVSKQLSLDLQNLANSLLSEEEFLEKYGHLRPGTYDINSPRYDEHFHTYFTQKIRATHLALSDDIFELSEIQKPKLEQLLIEQGVKLNVDEFMTFIKEAVEGREYAKLIFTRSLSKILSLIEELGERFDISKEDLAYLDFREILKLYAELDHRNMATILSDTISLNKEYYQYTKLVRFPTLITLPEDIYRFHIECDEPTFISLEQTEAEVLPEENLTTTNPKGKIVFIESADPGYDFLFSKGIAGLVTQFGGANSHMAIRCAELGLPAVIGAGEQNFSSWIKHKIIRLDCSSKQIIGVV